MILALSQRGRDGMVGLARRRAVVALVVWVLLEWLRRTVNEVNGAVDDVWAMGKRVAQNTATTHMLAGTKELGVELLEEVQRHGELAERRKG